MKNYFTVNSQDQVDIYSIEAIRAYDEGLVVVACGKEYPVEESRVNDLLSIMKMAEQSSNRLAQYTAV